LVNAMILDTLDAVFQALDIRGASPEKFLESDLGFDFEERLYIREDLEERLHVVILDHEIKSDLTVLEFAGLLSRKLLVTPGKQHFEDRLVEDLAISSSTKIVGQSLRDMRVWPRLLPGVHSFRLTYDDGLHQELAMDMDAGNGNPASVRLVLRCEPDHISFFYPEPASFLKHHYGDWFIHPLAENATHLTLVERWTLSAKGKALFPQYDGMSSRQRVSALLSEYAHVALTALKGSLERPDKAPHEILPAGASPCENDRDF
jgi:hypothetical protein